MKQQLGPTGEFPNGMINQEDDGELVCAIGTENGVVKIKFGVAIEWIGFPPDNAIEFANAILDKARGLKQ